VPDIASLLWPRSVAVVGASSDTHALRGRIFETIRGQPFAGHIYPVSRSATVVQGETAYPSVDALPERPDLAILIVPAAYVVAELERCGRAGVKAAAILSSGFAEAGENGAQLQGEITAIAQRYDMAVSGPNSEGFTNIAAALCANFSPASDKSAGPLTPSRPLGGGQVSVISQSGGLGFACFDRARPREFLFRYIVTTGNEATLEVADFVDYMLDEGKTDVFLLLIEAIKTPAKFKRVAEKALKAGKPLIVGKIGQSEPGRRAVMSHTAALAGAATAYSAVFERYGVIEARDFDEVLDLAAGFLACKGKLPVGKRVGICTASGGAGIWMADACAAAGLDVPTLDDATRAELSTHVPPYGTSQNPVDFTAQGVQKLGYAEFARIVARSPSIDSVIVVITARRSAFLEADLPKFKELARTTEKPVLMWSYTLPSERTTEILNDIGFPLFMSAPGCARTLRKLVDYRARREQSETIVDTPTPRATREETAAALAKSPAIICEYRAQTLLAPYGIGGKNAGQIVHSGDEAAAAAKALGGPVALKVQSAEIPHKTEAGAVILNLEGPENVRTGYDSALAAAKGFAPTAQIDGVLVQPMAAAGREVIVGINHDLTWGPLLLVGLGGVLAEALGDVAVAPAPLDQAQARALVRRLKGADIFGCYRGQAPADIEALSLLMVRLSQFAYDHAEEISAIDLNPVIVHDAGDGVTVVDALITKRRGGAAELHDAGSVETKAVLHDSV
jgi:acyl-CoA synthetase (NDP forming)